MTSKLTEVAIDCADPEVLARFWCSVLDYVVVDEGEGVVTIGPSTASEGRTTSAPCRRR